VEELTHFATHILAGRQPEASLRDGYRAMCVLEGIKESVRSGKTVEVGR
jgi:predicted dehydrogenase